MAGQKKVPDIRYAEFTDPWEKRKLGELVDIVGGGTPSTSISEYWDGDIDWYTPAEIGKQIFVYGSKKKITALGLQKSSAKILPIGTILFTSRAGIGNTAILAKEGATNQGFQSIIPRKELIDSYFIFSRTHELKAYGETIGAGSTFIEVSGKQMAKMPLLMPLIEEQTKIGQILSTLDHLITLHQREYSKTVNIKKSMLEKMFPQNGADRPEIRFAGFTDPWEWRELGEVSNKITEKNTNRIFLETLTNSAEYGIISQRDFFDKDISNEENLDGYYIVKNDDFVYNPRMSSLAPVGPIKRNKLGRTGAMSPLYYVFRTHDIEVTYLEHFFSGKSWHSFMNFNGDSGARSDRFAIKDSIFRNMPIPYPCLEEQAKIGQFFYMLDQLIALHQRELVKLQNIKKALLEKMFV